MASTRTSLTELGTAVGMFTSTGLLLEALSLGDLPGLESSDWHGRLLSATGADQMLLDRALRNGAAFRSSVLGGRTPSYLEWLGGRKAVSAVDAPVDLRVDHAFLVQAKYGSKCMLNTNPPAMFLNLLKDDGQSRRESWFATVAPAELQSLYAVARDAHPDLALPSLYADLKGGDRDRLKERLKTHPVDAGPAGLAAYSALATKASAASAAAWRASVATATSRELLDLACRLIRIGSSQYWLLGYQPSGPVRLRACDNADWRNRFSVLRLSISPASSKQPQVDWLLEISDKRTADTHAVRGCCEVRWSHGKLNGQPECKVQLKTPLPDVPGYDPM